MRVIEGVAARVPEMETDPVIEGLSDLLGEELEVWVREIEDEELAVTVLDREGLGVEEIGGDGDIIPTLPKK